MFEVSPATRIVQPTGENANNQVIVWPVVFEDVDEGYPNSTCARISQGRDSAQQLADALNKTLTDFLSKLVDKKPEK